MYVKQVIGIRDVIPPPIPSTFSDVYIATELMDSDLHQIIRSNQGLSEEHSQVTDSFYPKFIIWHQKPLNSMDLFK